MMYIVYFCCYVLGGEWLSLMHMNNTIFNSSLTFKLPALTFADKRPFSSAYASNATSRRLQSQHKNESQQPSIQQVWSIEHTLQQMLSEE